MILGQSAATAAVLSLEKDVAVQDLPYETLRQRMLADGQVLELSGPSAVRSDELIGIVVDDHEAKLTGVWAKSTSIKPYVGSGYLHDNDEGKGEKSITFSVTLDDGDYDVRVAYTANPNRASQVPVVIQHANGATQQTINQKKTPEHDDLFTSLGVYSFNAKQAAVVKIQTSGTNGHVVADAVQWVRQNK